MNPVYRAATPAALIPRTRCHGRRDDTCLFGDRVFANRSPTLANRSLLSAPGNGFQQAETGGRDEETARERAARDARPQKPARQTFEPTRSLANHARDPPGAECVVGAAGLEPTTGPLSAAGDIRDGPSNLRPPLRTKQPPPSRVNSSVLSRLIRARSSPRIGSSLRISYPPAEQRFENSRRT